MYMLFLYWGILIVPVLFLATGLFNLSDDDPSENNTWKQKDRR